MLAFQPLDGFPPKSAIKDMVLTRLVEGRRLRTLILTTNTEAELAALQAGEALS